MKFTFAPETRPLDGYTIKRAIHRGGFGEVYYALSDGGKEVALKLLNNNLDVELRGVTQCLNLKHPNLVTIFDIRQDADQDHWVVMEYVSGRGLYETMQDYPNGMPLEEVLAWLKGLCDGLSFLHDRGIVHRDLKPANVFREQGVVKIGDVGLSKYISESRRSAQTQSVGTVYYMAPEVARGRYGREVDVYAMGIMLYEMLTGRVPFEGQTTAEILMKHLTAEPDLSVLPAELQTVIASALEKDPDQRTASVELLEQQFCAAIKGSDVRTPLQHHSLHQATAMPDDGISIESSPTQAHRSTRSVDPAQADTVVGAPPKARSKSNTDVGLPASIAAFWATIPTPLQWVLGGTAAFLILESGAIRMVAMGAMIGGVAYLAYQMVQVVTRSGSEAKPAKRAHRHKDRQPGFETAAMAAPIEEPQFEPASPARRHQSASTKRIYTPATLRRLSRRQRATDLSTSVTVSLAAAVLVTLAIYLTTDLITNIAQAVYFGTITMLAAWAVIIPSKLWEGQAGDSFSRRLTLGSIGLGVGYLAAILPNYLLIEQDPLFAGGRSAPHLVGRIMLADGSGFPTYACFMLFFAALFSFRRWWWQVDSFRSARFRVSSALFTLLVGVVITGVLQEFSFPDALGATWALAISAVVQLSSGWTPPEHRSLQPAAEPTPVQTSPKDHVVPPLASREPTALHNA